MANKKSKKGEVKIDVRKFALRGGTIILLLIAVVLTAIAATGGWLFMRLVGYTSSDSEYKTEYISNDGEFIDRMSSRLVNHEYRLLADIEIDAETWNDTMSNVVLRGVLNGNGHKISIVGDLRIPLFCRIEKFAQVSYVSFVNVSISDANQASAAALALVNYGTVSNCTFVNAKATVSDERYVSFVVAHNFGTIENCVVSGKLIPNDNKSGATAIGGVAAINYKNAEIKNCLVDVTYERGFEAIEKPFFNENEVNDKLGYVVGQNSGKLSKLYCLNAERFSNSSDGKTEKSIENIKYSDLTKHLVLSLDFASDYWTVTDNQLPTLKIMVGTNV